MRFSPRGTFGQAAVLEEPASALRLGMKAGLNAVFDETKAKGGVHGRKLKLISINDGYEPDRAIAATKKLIEDDKVFMTITEADGTFKPIEKMIRISSN